MIDFSWSKAARWSSDNGRSEHMALSFAHNCRTLSSLDAVLPAAAAYASEAAMASIQGRKKST
eukprot:CAMPEP_0185808098 /NCGR_PEP_ID=MMETSP1322-20130828/5417_1 /TAXON_ID=265543 /ORGANISM="Minutocellus polymorphus, Strain RCC2270" /LENGTH=62 /DNA_ID=CAMNT_0028504297 /DNA_START=10 /DNA_END=194 /DNA_ORIENTATION=-